jgi:hypothetical protein
MSIRKDGEEEYRKFGDKKYVLVAVRSTKENADLLKARLTRIGTLDVKYIKYQENVVGLPPRYKVYARSSTIALDKVPNAARKLM